ncbi:sulfatase-like hydrolase/transferase [Psychrosphaera sp. F3M07]|uniref:sulfatase family protein n=1 Tax=Psychrosphaera sp. F3M07 TaxID=2841560 RepID=UPI001C07FF27|nr:sulfatase-like hydrolase/transferase [Psychrosphaera sp. F3M07]MBU2918844.1 sulfatase-like hydrolase/transferase [Psychrosphaera sp. F3M07]
MLKVTKLLYFILLLVSLSVTYADERPNIIVILADDLGYNDLGFTGNTPIQTPNLDELAAGGVIFKNGYVTHPYCGPSRAGLLTGRYQARFGMENNVSYSPYDPNMGLPLSEKTFAKRLQEVGYKTAVIGKWHLGGAEHFQPNNRGFDYFYGFLDGGHHYNPDQVSLNSDGYSLPLMRNKEVVLFDEYLTTALSRDAAQFVADISSQDKDTPFMMYLSYNAPHAPLQAPAETIKKYTHLENTNRQIYAAMVDEMDQGIGMVVDALKKHNQYTNTLIFFLSDNGGLYPDSWWPQFDWADNSPYRHGKVALMEGGVKVPFIAHWPAKIPKGEKFDGLVSALDLAATSVALAGADTSDGKLEGVDLTPYMTGEKTGSPSQALFWRLEEADHIWAVRTMESKYMNQALPGVNRAFFDMTTDPTEQYNIVDSNLNEQTKLAKLWNDWNKGNMNNILYQSNEYKQARALFYKELFEKNKQEAINKKTYTVK